jgi:hypothetical protein
VTAPSPIFNQREIRLAKMPLHRNKPQQQNSWLVEYLYSLRIGSTFEAVYIGAGEDRSGAGSCERSFADAAAIGE